MPHPTLEHVHRITPHNTTTTYHHDTPTTHHNDTVCHPLTTTTKVTHGLVLLGAALMDSCKFDPDNPNTPAHRACELGSTVRRTFILVCLIDFCCLCAGVCVCVCACACVCVCLCVCVCVCVCLCVCSFCFATSSFALDVCSCFSHHECDFFG
jgi:hypothetical protein